MIGRRRAAAPGRAQYPLVLWVRVALLFGVANGLAYGVSVGLAARLPPGRCGTAAGLVVSAYAAGPVVLDSWHHLASVQAGWRMSLAGAAVIVSGLPAAAS